MNEKRGLHKAGEKLDIVVYNKDVTITKDNNLVIQTGK